MAFFLWLCMLSEKPMKKNLIAAFLFSVYAANSLFGGVNLVYASSCSLITHNLYFGLTDKQTDNQVSALQRFLAKDPSLYPAGVVSGEFGQRTKLAVQRFQLRFGIASSLTDPASGGVGALTASKINALSCKGSDAASQSPITSTQPVHTPVSVSQKSLIDQILARIAILRTELARLIALQTTQSVQQSGVTLTPQSTFPPQAQFPEQAPSQNVSLAVQSSVTQAQSVVPAPVVPALSVPVATPTEPVIATRLLTTTHRFEQNVAFGGWGPHLGHLLRASNNTLWFADDTGNSASTDAGISYYTRTVTGWQSAGFNDFVGNIQQNTGSLMLNDYIYSYGIDTANHRIEECYFGTKDSKKACNHLPFVLDAQANYIGAAISPAGYKLVWWTDVRDNAAGNFNYIYNFGSGWNGPVSAVLPGFSDASYINVSFTDDQRFTMIGQLTSGAAPNWNFTAAVYEGVIGQSSSWTTLPGLSGDPAISTNDIWIDPVTHEGHMLIRTRSGSMAYLYKPAGGVWQGPFFSTPNSFRSRFAYADGTLFVAYGIDGKGIAYRSFKRGGTTGVLPWSTTSEKTVTLPSGYEQIHAIYPEAAIYQQTAGKGLTIAVNGAARQGELFEISIEP